MKDYFKNPVNMRQTEFWTATGIVILSVLFFNLGETHRYQYPFDEARIPFNYYENYFFPQLARYALIYLAFLLLNFKIVPQLLQKENIYLQVVLALLIFLVAGLVLGITDTHLKNYIFNRHDTEEQALTAIFRDSYLFAFRLLVLFAVYTFIKFTTLYLLSNSQDIQSRYKIITQDSLLAFVLWMVSIFLLLLIDAEGEFILGWSIVIPFGILFYSYSFYTLIPDALTKKHPFRAYLLKVFLRLIISIIPVALLTLLISHDEEFALGLGAFNAVFQLLITTPLCWMLFKRRLKGREELHVLKKELGHSNASLDFLRSQINPHFLFNALNTIYGTAIQENAERTGEGILKLGDMMRFMMQENMQEKISLVREIEYLNNYISLQKLRTDSNPGIQIQTEIEEPANLGQIAPMLLIPFVENAFKHGISFREPSHIKITLEVKENTLNFDVYNSKHLRPENDPEKNNNGIGLNNVKQRLQLLYSHQHELIIRETGKEFFVHLTLQLT